MIWFVLLIAIVLLCVLWVHLVARRHQRLHDQWLQDWAARMNTPLHRSPDEGDDWR